MFVWKFASAKIVFSLCGLSRLIPILTTPGWSDSTCIAVGIFQAKSGQCGIDWLGDLVPIWISFALARGLGLWLLFSCFGCCVCGLSTNWLDDNWNWHVTNLHRRLLSSVCSFSPRRNWLFIWTLVFWPSFSDFFSVYFLPVAGWQSGTVLCAINFPTVSHSSPGPATLLDTIFDSIRFDCLTCGLDIYFHTHSTVCACGWRGSAARYRKCYFWLLFMRHDEATPRSLPVPFPISRRDRWPKRENNNDVGGWRLGRWMDRSLDGESVTR